MFFYHLRASRCEESSPNNRNSLPAVCISCSPFSMVNTKAMKTVHPSAVNPPPTAHYPRANRVYFFLSLWLCSFSTFLTIFCSSMRKARTIRSRTQLAHLEPPYARWTVFLGLEIWEYSRGRRAGTCIDNMLARGQSVVVVFGPDPCLALDPQNITLHPGPTTH